MIYMAVMRALGLQSLLPAAAAAAAAAPCCLKSLCASQRFDVYPFFIGIDSVVKLFPRAVISLYISPEFLSFWLTTVLFTCDETWKEKIIVNFAPVLSFVVDMQLLYLFSIVVST